LFSSALPPISHLASSDAHLRISLQSVATSRGPARFSDAPLTACPSCNAEGLIKLVSAAGFQLKGSGWYATDFKSGGKKPADKAPAGEAKAEAKADAKAETKAEPSAPTGGCGSGCACH
jgi:predicted nucleic acid-binding Zn ribbon protein